MVLTNIVYYSERYNIFYVRTTDTPSLYARTFCFELFSRLASVFFPLMRRYVIIIAIRHPAFCYSQSNSILFFYPFLQHHVVGYISIHFIFCDVCTRFHKFLRTLCLGCLDSSGEICPCPLIRRGDVDAFLHGHSVANIS